MLHAYLKHKSGKEDSKTSMVFGILLHLPSRRVWQVIRNSCTNKGTLPETAGKITSYEFWPSYSAEGTTNKNRVEPDLIVNFEEFTLIIEAKLKDVQGYTQATQQWKNELQSYRNEGHTENVIILSIGGNTDMATKSIGSVTIYKATWIDLLETIHKIRENEETTESETRILEDLEATFGYFREYYISTWLKDIPTASISADSNKQINELWKI